MKRLLLKRLPSDFPALPTEKNIILIFRRGGSNVYQKSMFWRRRKKKKKKKKKKRKKNRYTPAYPQFYYIKVGPKGVFISQTCFLMNGTDYIQSWELCIQNTPFKTRNARAPTELPPWHQAHIIMQ